jgi:predicted DNA-binding transcriptional regulator AlpA
MILKSKRADGDLLVFAISIKIDNAFQERRSNMQQSEKMEQTRPEADNNPAFISVDEMAKMLSIARATAYQVTKTRDFPCFYIGKRIIIPLRSFQEWAAKQADSKTCFNGRDDNYGKA